MFGIFNIRTNLSVPFKFGPFLKFAEYGKTQRDLARAEASSEKKKKVTRGFL